MKFAIAIPQFYADGEFDPASFREYFARAEELGFDSAWTQESTLGFGPQLSPIETMTYAAACTERIRLGCVVFVSTLHSPVHLAKSLSTLDQLSRGRIEVGVGTGGRGRPFAAFGVNPARYVSRFTEGVNLMKALWDAGAHPNYTEYPGVAHNSWDKAYATADLYGWLLKHKLK